MANVGCRCTSGDGGKKAWVDSGDGETFVHIQCLQPSRAVVEGDTVLNLFTGGDHHNELVETPDLMKLDKAWIAAYKWTPQKVTGSVSGREARVWVHESLAEITA